MIATSLPFASVLPHSRCNLCQPNNQGVQATFWLYSFWLWTNITHLSTPSETISAVLERAVAGWGSLSPCLTYKVSIIVWSQIHWLAHCLATLQWQCVSNICSKDNLNTWQQWELRQTIFSFLNLVCKRICTHWQCFIVIYIVFKCKNVG